MFEDGPVKEIKHSGKALKRVREKRKLFELRRRPKQEARSEIAKLNLKPKSTRLMMAMRARMRIMPSPKGEAVTGVPEDE